MNYYSEYNSEYKYERHGCMKLTYALVSGPVLSTLATALDGLRQRASEPFYNYALFSITRY